MSKVENQIIYRVFVILGSITTVMLLAISCTAWYGYIFITDNVRTELSAQRIYFPAKGSTSFSPTEFPDIQQYAGQLVDDGIKAQAYANGFIGRHLNKIADGKTYSEVSIEAMADPTNQTLQQQKQSLFQGTMLRGMLLGNGYAYWTMGIVAKYVAVITFVGACVVIALVCLGLNKIRLLGL